MSPRAVLPLLALSLAASAAAAQSAPYVRVSVGPARLEAPPGGGFRAETAVQPTLAVGWERGGRHALELRVGYLRSSTTEARPSSVQAEAPLTVGVRAVPVALGYQLRLRPGARVSPVAGIAATWTRVEDSWRSDTPEESRRASVYGLDASAGLSARLAGAASLVARGGYRVAEDAEDRFTRSIGLRGSYADVGVQLRL